MSISDEEWRWPLTPSQAMVTFWPTLYTAIRPVSAVGEPTVCPSTPTMTSPAASPAFSAGAPLTTSRMTAPLPVGAW